MKRKQSTNMFYLFLAVILGLLAGSFATEDIIRIILPVKHVLGQIIFFLIPLLIFGFIAPSIARLKKNASKFLGATVILAYFSCIGSATLAAVVGYNVIPLIHITPEAEAQKALPEMIFRLDIPPVMSVLSALVLAFTVGLSVLWTNAKNIENILNEFQDMILVTVKKVLIPVLPFFIAANFSVFAYEGALSSKLPVFFIILLVTLSCHIVWLAFLYIAAGIYSKKNPWLVLQYYGPVVLTALGTQSSAASLGIAIEQTRKVSVFKPDVRDFSIPLLGNIHFPGSILDIVFLALAVSQLLYGNMPDIEKMIIFIPLLAVFAIAAPGLPGGTLLTSLGLIHVVLGMDEAGTALMIVIFALLDSFGTTHNITSDGALTLFLSSHGEQNEANVNQEDKSARLPGRGD